MKATFIPSTVLWFPPSEVLLSGGRRLKIASLSVTAALSVTEAGGFIMKPHHRLFKY
jgi:hypothetical protein